MKKLNKVFIGLASIVGLSIIGFVFTHSTPERAIRADLFFKGHYYNSLKIEVFKNGIDSQYGQNFSTKNPSIGADFYRVEKGFLNLWFVNPHATGGG